MNFSLKRTYFTREIELLFITNKRSIVITFIDNPPFTNEHIEITHDEFHKINIDYLDLIDRTDQDKPDGS